MIAQYAQAQEWRYAPSVAKTEDYGEANHLDQYSGVDLGDGAGAGALTYDANGNLTSDGEACADGQEGGCTPNGRTYSYNSENQLVHAVGPGFEMEYVYDGRGRRTNSPKTSGYLE